MLLYRTRTRRTCSIPSLVLIVCRSRSSLFIETGCFFLVVSSSQCHRCKDVSTRPSEPLPIHILCRGSYILCNNRNIIVYVKVADLSLSPTLSRKIMFFTISCQPKRTLRVFSEEQISEEFHRQTKSNSSFSHKELRFIYTERKRFFLQTLSLFSVNIKLDSL